MVTHSHHLAHPHKAGGKMAHKGLVAPAPSKADMGMFPVRLVVMGAVTAHLDGETSLLVALGM